MVYMRIWTHTYLRYFKLSKINHNDIIFPTVPALYDDVILRRHDGFFNFLRIMSNLARYSCWNISHVIKTGKYVNLYCLTFQNLQTELKYHDYNSTICTLKRTPLLRRKCRKLGVSDDVIRKIMTSAKYFKINMFVTSSTHSVPSFITLGHS